MIIGMIIMMIPMMRMMMMMMMGMMMKFYIIAINLKIMIMLPFSGLLSMRDDNK
jgi:hypothetical protein